MRLRTRFWLLALAIMCVGCARGIPAGSVYPATPTYSDDVEARFLQILAESISLNSEITLERSEPIVLDSRSLRTVTFAVFNHADEAVIFPNQGFGLELYYFAAGPGSWLKLDLPHWPEARSKSLPPQTLTWGSPVGNDWTILPEDVRELGVAAARILVTGKGARSDAIYGAFMDVAFPGD